MIITLTREEIIVILEEKAKKLVFLPEGNTFKVNNIWDLPYTLEIREEEPKEEDPEYDPLADPLDNLEKKLESELNL